MTMSVEKDDLRSALEEAFNATEGDTDSPSSEAGRPAEDTAQPVRTTAPTERSEPVGDAAAATDQPVSGEGKERGPDGKFLKKPQDQQQATPERKQDSSTQFRAPESWKPQAKEHWTKLPPDVQHEVARREREIVMTLQQTAGARKVAEQFVAAVSPFEMMIRAEGADPISATRELFGQAAILRIGTPAQKAQLVATVVKRFGVPIKDLDAALVGEQIPDEEGKIAQIIQQQLAPVRQFMQSIEGVKHQRAQQVDGEIDNEINQFAADPTNEFFHDVKNEMADLMEVAARNGRTMTLKQAYDRAIAVNENIQAVIAQRSQQQVGKARAAGSSLPSRGAPPASGQQKGDSIRDDLLAAFDTVANQ
jgi:hypothetical protein